MVLLGTLTLLTLALLAGNELCVAVFLEPILRSLPDSDQVRLVPRFARRLGKAMPPWYALALLLTAATVWLQHSRTGIWYSGAFIALVLQLIVLAITLAFLVPRNSRLARMTTAYATWQSDAHQWDSAHWLRVVLLVAATVAFAFVSA